MPRFAANLTMMFNEVPFLDRFERAARAGFEAVEFLFPYVHEPEEIRQRLEKLPVTNKSWLRKRESELRGLVVTR